MMTSQYCMKEPSGRMSRRGTATNFSLVMLLFSVVVLKMGILQQEVSAYLTPELRALFSFDEVTLTILLLIALFITLNYKELLISGFDPEYAHSVRLPGDALQYLLWGLLAFCVISSLQVIGVILASALLIIPAASASLLAKRMSSYLWIAATLGAVSGFGGGGG